MIIIKNIPLKGGENRKHNHYLEIKISRLMKKTMNPKSLKMKWKWVRKNQKNKKAKLNLKKTNQIQAK